MNQGVMSGFQSLLDSESWVQIILTSCKKSLLSPGGASIGGNSVNLL